MDGQPKARPGFGDLPFFPGLPQAFWGRLFCFFAAHRLKVSRALRLPSWPAGMAASFPLRRNYSTGWIPCKIKKFGALRQQQSQIDFARKAAMPHLMGMASTVELGRKTVDQAQGHVGQKDRLPRLGQQQHVLLSQPTFSAKYRALLGGSRGRSCVTGQMP